ncbi:serine hydrolase [Rhodococcus sp. PvR099]|jgi:D-alanyl-D-alanine carboxypeptidase|uniref:serine hydrolase domain-containing protein n=1 Tax=Rhodococcus sp. PvR099 TaxID=2806602 RepID=UPI001B438C2D|nr:serine hydrolase domain-containing protein [Rhodococcus sp. PvR099]MBP1160678.1 D-alanyl-D-alanine carboxypeptidase [Rhodococcus sp. PvR099]
MVDALEREGRSMSINCVRSRRTLCAVVGALVVAVGATGCGGTGEGSASVGSESSAPAGVQMDQATTAKLDSAIAEAVRKTGVPGAIVGVWGPNGSYVRATGTADTATGAPMKTDFYSRIGSVTKTFTATALLQLVDEGKVGLDDPISKYVDGVTEGDRITLRHLAGMRSGLADYTYDEQFGTDFLADPKGDFSPWQLVGYVKGDPLHFEPGDRLEYSNTNFILLGMVVEKVSGDSMTNIIKGKILEPLGMKDTNFPTSNAFPEPHAQGYTTQTKDETLGVATDWNPSWGWAAGSMISTLDDLRTWAHALYKGDLLDADTQKQRLQMLPAEGIDGVGYGLGVFDVQGWIGHNGSLPGYKSVVVYLPEKDLTMVILINSDVDTLDTGSSGVLATAITEVISPDHLYTLSG